jgi:hypothetical protein
MAKNEMVALIDQSIARYQADIAEFDTLLQTEAQHALEDWLLMEACKDFDTIDLGDDIVGKARRKHWKALRDQKRNTEKMINALQALRETAAAPDGEKLRKKFEQETEKYQ